MAEKKEKRYVSDDAQLMSEWDLERNGDVLPSETSLWSHRKIWWKCERGHYWDATPHHRSYGTGCPYCSGKRVKAGYNDLATLFPEIGLEWNSEKNGDLHANAVSPSSNKRVWWKCKCDHEWQSVIASRTHGVGCPYCANKKVLVGFNDFATTHPELASEWHPRRLCEVVVKELQERKDILELIDRKRGFMTPWNAVMKSRTPFAASGKRWKSEYYADFLKNRLDSSLYDVERFAEKLDLVNTKTYQFEEMKNHAMAKYRYERFMRLIMKLIPESRCWSFEEWADENRIVDSLKLTMGIDFRNNWQQFDDVMRLLVWSENPSGYDRGMLSIRDVPFSVVKVIWPDNTEARVEELFMTACLDMRRHLQYEFTYANCVADNAYYLERQFIESWLYKQIKAWSHGDGYRLNHEIKKFLFDFEMGI